MSVRNLHEVRFMLISTPLIHLHNIWLGVGPIYNTYIYIYVLFFFFWLIIYTVGPDVG